MRLLSGRGLHEAQLVVFEHHETGVAEDATVPRRFMMRRQSTLAMGRAQIESSGGPMDYPDRPMGRASK